MKTQRELDHVGSHWAVNRPRRGKAAGPGASSGPSPAVGHGIPVAMPTYG